MRTTTTSRCWRAEQNERYLNKAWGGKGWFPAPQFMKDSKYRNTTRISNRHLSYLKSITKIAKINNVDLKSLWRPGGVLYEAMLEGSDKGSLVWTTITTQKAFKMILDRYPDCDYLGDNGHDDSTSEAGEDQRPDLEDEDDDENNDAAVTTPKADEAVSQQGVRAEGLQRKERRSARPTTRSRRTIELSKESPRSPNLPDVETLDSKGDVILSLDIPESAQPKKYLASSSVLLPASPVFQRKLAPVFGESSTRQHDETPCIPCEGNSADAMATILRIIHFTGADIPTKLEPQALVQIAVHANKYEIRNALEAWIQVWTARGHISDFDSR